MSTLEISNNSDLMKKVNLICTVLLVISTIVFSVSFASSVYFIISEHNILKQDVEYMQNEYTKISQEHHKRVEDLKKVTILFQNKKTMFDVRVSRLQSIENDIKILNQRD